MLFLSWNLFESWQLTEKSLFWESGRIHGSGVLPRSGAKLQDKLFLSLSSTKWRAEHVDHSRITPAFTLNFFDTFRWRNDRAQGSSEFTLWLLWPAPQAVLARPKGPLGDCCIDPRAGSASRRTHDEEQSCVLRMWSTWCCSSGQASWPPLVS